MSQCRITHRVIIYTRVSTEEQGLSLSMQESRCRAYADLYELDIVTVHSDPGASAKTLQRPGLTSALEACTREGHGLLIYKLDRLTRSVRDLGTLIEGPLETVSLYSVSEQIDTRTPGGRLVLNILVSVAQWEREEISARTKAALNAKQRTHRYADLTAIVREMRDDELSLAQISRRLVRLGHTAENGAPFAPAQIKRILDLT